MSNVYYEEMKLAELRELFPDIKSNSQSGFLKKLKAEKPELFNQVTLDEAIEEAEFEMPVDKDAVRDVEPQPEPVAEPEHEEEPIVVESGQKFEVVLGILDKAVGQKIKILLLMSNSQERRFVYNYLKERYKDSRMFVPQDSAMEFHAFGKTFVKCVCPNRYTSAKETKKYDLDIKVI